MSTLIDLIVDTQLCPNTACKTGNPPNLRPMTYTGETEGVYVFTCPHCKGQKFFKKAFWSNSIKYLGTTCEKD